MCDWRRCRSGTRSTTSRLADPAQELLGAPALDHGVRNGRHVVGRCEPFELRRDLVGRSCPEPAHHQPMQQAALPLDPSLDPSLHPRSKASSRFSRSCLPHSRARSSNVLMAPPSSLLSSRSSSRPSRPRPSATTCPAHATNARRSPGTPTESSHSSREDTSSTSASVVGAARTSQSWRVRCLGPARPNRATGLGREDTGTGVGMRPARWAQGRSFRPGRSGRSRLACRCRRPRAARRGACPRPWRACRRAPASWDTRLTWLGSDSCRAAAARPSGG